MFVLSLPLHRNGAMCREYYQPDEQGFIPGVVDTKHRAKQYVSEEAAREDIPNWIALSTEDLRKRGWGGDLAAHEKHMREGITVEHVDQKAV